MKFNFKKPNIKKPKFDIKKPKFNFNTGIKFTNLSKPASIKMQQTWRNMPQTSKNVLKKLLPDSDRDGVPNGFDCQPFNPKKQDSENYQIINLTPHAINIYNDNNELIKTIPSSGVVRVKADTERIGCINIDGEKIWLSRTKYGNVEGLPPKKNNTIYIVSSLVCAAANERDDLYIPNETVRDEQGRIIGCKSLAINPYLS